VVTLLAWAEYLNLLPADLNRIFAAKNAGKLRTAEEDKRKTIIFSLCWPGRVLAGFEFIAAFIAMIVVFGTHPGLLLHPFGWWTIALMVGVGVLPCVFYIVISETNLDDATAWFGLASDSKKAR
jgi:hypothetical protein